MLHKKREKKKLCRICICKTTEKKSIENILSSFLFLFIYFNEVSGSTYKYKIKVRNEWQ